VWLHCRLHWSWIFQWIHRLFRRSSCLFPFWWSHHLVCLGRRRMWWGHSWISSNPMVASVLVFVSSRLFPRSCHSFFHERKSEYDSLLVCVVDVGIHCQIHLEFNQKLFKFLSFPSEGCRCVHLDFFVLGCSSSSSWFLCYSQWRWFELDQGFW